MNKPWVFVIGLGTGTLMGVVGHMAWTFADGLGDALVAAGNTAAGVTYMQITIDEQQVMIDNMKSESDLLRTLAVHGLQGAERDQLLEAARQIPNISVFGTTGPDVHVQHENSGTANLIFENNRLVWITNHCERNAATSVTCRPTGAN
ncbi:hypothetical protein [Parasulfitobacter algicola]|uniref:Uncharacterized protein n=1 Tax=Parasulfitobacter algicola TaxID=2614809 RepID=A0ABX2J0G4_9RHOB|nr:hypothetical protein [Sulfitobacter algicola]NSX56243.1 hypothetical protein [Sulfitobacter algicola]